MITPQTQQLPLVDQQGARTHHATLPHPLSSQQQPLHLAHRIALQEQERKRLARTLHDGPIQALIGMSMELGLCCMKTKLEELEKWRQRCLLLAQELRGICSTLRPPDLDMIELSAAIRCDANKKANLCKSIKLDLIDNAEHLPSSVALSLFRIYQEATQNSLKHAQAKQIKVKLYLEQTHTILSISDDGKGFELPARLEELAHHDHFGLLGMQERADAIGAQLEITSKPGHGTKLEVRVRHYGDW